MALPISGMLGTDRSYVNHNNPLSSALSGLKHNEANKRWQEKNREKLSEYNKKYREENPEKVLALKRAYNEKNKEKIRENNKKYRNK